jgi:23S rRNA (pseudouridine1915-N3)-methyltransferase
LAARFAGWRESGRVICFVIGGAAGFDARVLARADFVLSFGTMTWPHLLVRTMLAEQMYRAQSILAGHPYHRAGRPADRI